MRRDQGLDTLLELSGTQYREENGYWYRIEAWRVEPSAEIPHGIRYNLTLHDRFNQRILGFDNAHAPKTKKGKYKGRIVEYDHAHHGLKSKGTPYTLVNAEMLLADFFEHVTRILNELEHSE